MVCSWYYCTTDDGQPSWPVCQFTSVRVLTLKEIVGQTLFSSLHLPELALIGVHSWPSYSPCTIVIEVTKLSVYKYNYTIVSSIDLYFI